ncbi:MAG: MarC family protein [Spirochaetaceae bacterium]|jgi:hypothetical protein|nr:MarC family protein [Spirochaetaceae bacterium]
MFAVLRTSVLILRILGTMGIFVMEKIMGLILAGFSVQLIYNGLVISEQTRSTADTLSPDMYPYTRSPATMSFGPNLSNPDSFSPW